METLKRIPFCSNSELVFAILMIIFLCGCTQKDPQVLLEKKQYPEEIQALKSEVLPIEEEILDGRFGIFGCNASVFMIEDLGDEEGFLHFYDWDTGKLIRKYGTIGRGPEEYLLPIVLPYRDSIVLHRYQLDLPIYSFCVNEEKRCFLAMVYTKDRIPMVVKYAY